METEDRENAEQESAQESTADVEQESTQESTADESAAVQETDEGELEKAPGNLPDPNDAGTLPEENEEVRGLLQERDQYRDALIQERADFENYKKSHAAHAASAFDNGVGTAAVAILPVLDNFERALAAECADPSFAEGMQMIMRQMQTALNGLGVDEVDTSGEFDPTIHHAVAQTEDPDLASNQIAETLQKGYSLKGKLLRPAMVKVNK